MFFHRFAALLSLLVWGFAQAEETDTACEKVQSQKLQHLRQNRRKWSDKNCYSMYFRYKSQGTGGYPMSSIWPVVVQDGKQLEGYSNDSMNDLYKFARDCIKDSCNSCHVEYGDVGDISSVTWITEEGNYLIETSRLKLCETWEDPSSGFSAEGAIDRSNA